MSGMNRRWCGLITREGVASSTSALSCEFASNILLCEQAHLGLVETDLPRRDRPPPHEKRPEAVERAYSVLR